MPAGLLASIGTATGGTWRLTARRDCWSKYEFGWHLSPTANQHDALAAIDLAIAEAARVAGGTSLLEQVTITPALAHVRTRVRSPGQNGTRERGFGTQGAAPAGGAKYEWLYREAIDSAMDLAAHAEAYRIEYNTVRPHEAIAWNRPHDVHTGHADPAVPTFDQPGFLPTT